MAIVVQNYTLRDHMFTPAQVEAAYAKLQAMGFDGIEGAAGGQFWTPEEQLAMLAKYNLKICVGHGDITKPDEAMKAAEKMGVKILSIGAIPGNMMGSSDGFYAYAEKMNELAKPFKGTGFRLQYHNHAQEFRNFANLNGKSGYEILVDETDPEVIVFELDCHWASAAGCDPAQWVRKLKGRIPVIHFKDYAIDEKAPDTGLGSVPKRFAEIGQGNINWPPIVEACAYAGTEWFSIEQDRTVLDPFDCLKISIDYMRSIGVK